MTKYKEAYFKLFSAICDGIESQEQLLSETALPESVKQLLQSQTEILKTAEQETEEILIRDGD